jgi:hypothetical protein
MLQHAHKTCLPSHTLAALQVRLLLGEVPEREEFSAPGMHTALAPYFELTCAVRSGDLAQFRAVSEKFAAAFRADCTTNLITRLQYNVIRTGLRRINLAYSRISLKVPGGLVYVGPLHLCPALMNPVLSQCSAWQALRGGGKVSAQRSKVHCILAGLP